MTGAAVIGENLLRGGTQLAFGSKGNEIKAPTEKIPLTMEADVVVVGVDPGLRCCFARGSNGGEYDSYRKV